MTTSHATCSPALSTHCNGEKYLLIRFSMIMQHQKFDIQHIIAIRQSSLFHLLAAELAHAQKVWLFSYRRRPENPVRQPLRSLLPCLSLDFLSPLSFFHTITLHKLVPLPQSRNEQPTNDYNFTIPNTFSQHSFLCICVRVQREQVLSQPESGLDPGPPEAHFSLEPSELSGETERELQLLRQDKARLEGQLREAQKPVVIQTRLILH